jgi:hypothetical protein
MAGFDPEKAFKELQLDNPVSGQASAFDPMKAAAELGLEVAPDGGNIQDGSTAAKAFQTYKDFAPVAGQGIFMGKGRDLNAGVQAAAGAVDQAVNGMNNFGDQSAPDAGILTRSLDALRNIGKNYDRAKKGVSEQIQATRNANPIASALTEIASSVPTALGTSEVLGGAGVADPKLQAAIQGGIYGYNSSDKQGLAKLGDALTSAGISYATAGAFQIAGKGIKEIKNADYGKYLESEYGDYTSPIKAIQEMSGSATKADPYALNLKTSNGDAFKLGQEMGKVLTNPDTQLAITNELNSQPQVVANLIKQTKSNIAPKWDAGIKEYGAAPVDVENAFKNAYDKVNTLYTEGHEVNSGLKEALKKQIQTFEDSLLAKSPSGTLKDVPLSAIADTQQQLGDIVFQQKAFQASPAVNGAAKSFWGKIADSFNKADETVGTGGELSNINKVYKALYNMDNSTVSGATIKAMTDPQAAGALQKYSELTAPLKELSPELRQTLTPELHDYFANQFPKVLAKAKTMLLVTERGGQAGSAGKQFLSLAGLRGLTKSSMAYGSNLAGAVSASPMVDGFGGSIGMLGQAAGQGLQKALPVAAPSIGALTTQQGQDQGQPSLRELK